MAWRVLGRVPRTEWGWTGRGWRRLVCIATPEATCRTMGRTWNRVRRPVVGGGGGTVVVVGGTGAVVVVVSVSVGGGLGGAVVVVVGVTRAPSSRCRRGRWLASVLSREA